MPFGPCFMCFIYTPKKTVCLKLHLTFSLMYPPVISDALIGFSHTAFEYFYCHHSRPFQWYRFFFFLMISHEEKQPVKHPKLVFSVILIWNTAKTLFSSLLSGQEKHIIDVFEEAVRIVTICCLQYKCSLVRKLCHVSPQSFYPSRFRIH